MTTLPQKHPNTTRRLVREINAAVRACDGRNVYLKSETATLRVIAARQRSGVMECKAFGCDGWVTVDPNLPGWVFTLE